MKQLEEIKARASAAAVGPWRWDENFGDKGDEGTALTNDAGDEIIGAYNWHCCSYRDEPTVDESSAPFIASARTDVPRLVAALEAVLALAAHSEAIGAHHAVQPAAIRSAINSTLGAA